MRAAVRRAQQDSATLIGAVPCLRHLPVTSSDGVRTQSLEHQDTLEAVLAQLVNLLPVLQAIAGAWYPCGDWQQQQQQHVPGESNWSENGVAAQPGPPAVDTRPAAHVGELEVQASAGEPPRGAEEQRPDPLDVEEVRSDEDVDEQEVETNDITCSAATSTCEDSLGRDQRKLVAWFQRMAIKPETRGLTGRLQDLLRGAEGRNKSEEALKQVALHVQSVMREGVPVQMVSEKAMLLAVAAGVTEMVASTDSWWEHDVMELVKTAGKETAAWIQKLESEPRWLEWLYCDTPARWSERWLRRAEREVDY